MEWFFYCCCDMIIVWGRSFVYPKCFTKAYSHFLSFFIVLSQFHTKAMNMKICKPLTFPLNAINRRPLHCRIYFKCLQKFSVNGVKYFKFKTMIRNTHSQEGEIRNFSAQRRVGTFSTTRQRNFEFNWIENLPN